jgi:hypothetical protein
MAPGIGSRRSPATIPIAARSMAGLLLSSTLLVGCASVATTPRPSVLASPSDVATTPTLSIPLASASPSATPSTTVIASPLVVVASPPASVGPYTLGLVDAEGRVFATATGNTPNDYTLTADPALTSTSDSRLYYEDGNTNIAYLTPTGQHGVAFTISRPAGAAVAFAVSPDDSTVAVAVLTNWDGAEPPYTSHMYLMAMGGGSEQTLFDGTSTSNTEPLTWPVGWDDGNLVVAQSLSAYFSGIAVTQPCSGWGVNCASQMRTFNLINRTFGPPLCAGYIEHLSGNPTPAGIACEINGPENGPGQEALQAYSWSGVKTSFGLKLNLPADQSACMLSPHGAVIACPSVIYNPPPSTAQPQYFPAQLFRSGGSVQTIPNPYDAQVIGWIDGNDVVVTTGIDSTGLAVENIVTGKRIAFLLARSPDPWIWQTDGMIPGGL